MPQISQEENEILTQAFSENEVFEAIKQMEHNKALGPDGLPVEFYQKCWHIIKVDLGNVYPIAYGKLASF